jgi:hypothetical protein
MTATQPLVIDAEAASPSDLPVDDDAPYVGAVLNNPQILEAERAERLDANAGTPESLEIGVGQARAERIVEQVHGDAGTSPLAEQRA